MPPWEHSREGDENKGIVVEHSTRLQWMKDKIDDHELRFQAGNKRFEQQEKMANDMLDSLNKINDNVKAFKWFLGGGVAVFCLNQFGVFAVVRTWFRMP